MKGSFFPSLQRYFLSAALLATVMLFAASVLADPVLRIVKFTAAPDQQQQLSKLRDEANKVYVGAKGCKWVKFYNDPATGERGSVSLWDSEADVKAFLQSAEYKPILEKLKPLVKGEMSSKIYIVEEVK
jgi:quinol monooxygenase YgiN